MVWWVWPLCPGDDWVAPGREASYHRWRRALMYWLWLRRLTPIRPLSFTITTKTNQPTTSPVCLTISLSVYMLYNWPALLLPWTILLWLKKLQFVYDEHFFPHRQNACCPDSQHLIIRLCDYPISMQFNWAWITYCSLGMKVPFAVSSHFNFLIGILMTWDVCLVMWLSDCLRKCFFLQKQKSWTEQNLTAKGNHGTQEGSRIICFLLLLMVTLTFKGKNLLFSCGCW